jgi:hypothetical protein
MRKNIQTIGSTVKIDGSMRNSRWVRLLAYVTGSINQELLLWNEYLAAENRILRTKLPARLRLSDPERITLAEIGKRLGRRALREIAWFGWRERTRAGAMTASSAPWPTWVTGCRIRR